MQPAPERPRVVISNRGPVSFSWEHGRWACQPSAGGLASMLTPLVHQHNLVWVCCVAEPPQARGSRSALQALAAEVHGDVRVIPVTLPAPVYAPYYNGVSNEVLWMVQHRLVGGSGMAPVDDALQRAWHDGYLAANRMLAAAVAEVAPDARAYLVQDYHLYPLPALLRELRPGVPILHFTHIPFGAPSVWGAIPRAWATTILSGLLGADLVGLQTPGDVDALLASCRQLLGVATERERTEGALAGRVILTTGRTIRVRAYPASIDPSSLRAEMRSERVEAARARLSTFAGVRLVVRADRLDPAKNQLAAFEAFGRLLAARSDLHGRVRFLAVLVPSRTELRAYREYGAAVLRVVDAVNERFADSCGGPPIVLHLENDRAYALAMLERCDVLVANSVADGMNLVPKEWAVIARRPGVAVLSQAAGIAAEAAGCALLVPPRDVEATARALADALDMPEPERASRLDRFRARVLAWTSADWLGAQLSDLEAAVGDAQPFDTCVPLG